MREYKDWQHYKVDQPPKKLFAIVISITLVLILSTFCSCNITRKIFHKEKSRKDSAVVEQRDSIGHANVNVHEMTWHLDSPEVVIEYDTARNFVFGFDGTNFDSSRESMRLTPEGKFISDVIKASTQAGKPSKIIIRAAKANRTEKQETKESSSEVHEKKEVKLSEKKMVMDKSQKKRLNMMWVIALLFIALVIYVYRKKIWQFILTIIPI